MHASRRNSSPGAAGPAVLLAFLAVLLAGCTGGEAAVQNATQELKSQIDAEAASVDSLSATLDTRISDMTVRMDEAEARHAQILAAFERGKLRPSEVRQEMVEVVDAQSAAVYADQDAVKGKIASLLDEADARVTRSLAEETKATTEALGKLHAFLQFFYTEQDSVNRAFLERLEEKPWYSTIVSDWKEPAP